MIVIHGCNSFTTHMNIFYVSYTAIILFILPNIDAPHNNSPGDAEF